MKTSKKKGRRLNKQRRPRANSLGEKSLSKKALRQPRPVISDTQPLVKILTVVSETDHSIVLDKPAFLDCQNSKSNRPSIVQWLEEKYAFSGLVHRLDFGTSGLLLCAKTKEAAKTLSEALKKGDIKRTYHAIVIGKNLPNHGELSDDLDGKPALTSFKKLKDFANASLIEVTLHTGRKHQIRRHFFNQGSPLIGDHRYKKKGSHLLFNRPALHAVELKVLNQTYRSEYPEDFKLLIKRLSGR